MLSAKEKVQQYILIVYYITLYSEKRRVELQLQDTSEQIRELKGMCTDEEWAKVK